MPQGPPKLGYGELNDVRTPTVRSTPVQPHGNEGATSILRMAAITADNAARTDAVANLGPIKAIVLKVIQSNEKPATNPDVAKEEWMLNEKLGVTDAKKIVRFHAMVPELFTYPVPRSYEDHVRIDRYPIFSSGDDTLPVPSPGDIVIVGFENLEELSGGRYFGFAAPAVGQQKIDSKPKPCPPPNIKAKGKRGALGGIQHPAQHTGIKGPRARLRYTPRKCVAFGGNAISGQIGNKLFGYLFSKGWTFISDLTSTSESFLHNVPIAENIDAALGGGDGSHGERFLISPRDPKFVTPLSAWCRTHHPDGKPGPQNMTSFEQSSVASQLTDVKADQTPLLSAVKNALRQRPDMVLFSFDGFGKYVESIATDQKRVAALPGLMKKITAQFTHQVRKFAGECVIVIIAPYRNVTPEKTGSDQQEITHKTYCQYSDKGAFISSINTKFMDAIQPLLAADPKLAIIDPYDHGVIHDNSKNINKEGDEAIAIAVLERLIKIKPAGIDFAEQVKTSEEYIKPKRPRRKRRRKPNRAVSNGMQSQIKQAAKMLGTYNMMPKKDYDKAIKFFKKGVASDVAAQGSTFKKQYGNEIAQFISMAGSLNGVRSVGADIGAIGFFGAVYNILDSEYAELAKTDGQKKTVIDKFFGKGAFDFYKKYKGDNKDGPKPHWLTIINRKFDVAAEGEKGADKGAPGFIASDLDLENYLKSVDPKVYDNVMTFFKGLKADVIVVGDEADKKTKDAIGKAVKAIMNQDSKTPIHGPISDDESKSFITAMTKSDSNSKTTKEAGDKLQKLEDLRQKKEKARAYGGELEKHILTYRYSLSDSNYRQYMRNGGSNNAGRPVTKSGPQLYANAGTIAHVFRDVIDALSNGQEGDTLTWYSSIVIKNIYKTVGQCATPRNYGDERGRRYFQYEGTAKPGMRQRADSYGAEETQKLINKLFKEQLSASPPNYSNPHAIVVRANDKLIQQNKQSIVEGGFGTYWSIDFLPNSNDIWSQCSKIYQWLIAGFSGGLWGDYKLNFNHNRSPRTSGSSKKVASTSGAEGFSHHTMNNYYQDVWVKQAQHAIMFLPGFNKYDVEDFFSSNSDGLGAEESIYLHYGMLWDHTITIMNDIYQNALRIAARDLGIKFKEDYSIGGAMSFSDIYAAKNKTISETAKKIEEQIQKLITAYKGQRDKEEYNAKPANPGLSDPCFDEGSGLDNEDAKDEPMTKGEPIPPGQLVKCDSIGIKRAKFSFGNVRKRTRGGKVVAPWNIVIHESAGHLKHWKQRGAGSEEGNPHKNLANVLANRGYGVHFIIGGTGGIHQYNHINDRLIHAGRANTSAVGIEIPSIFKALKNGKPWVKKGGSGKKYEWRYAKQGFVTRAIIKACVAGSAKRGGEEFTGLKVTGVSPKGGIGGKWGFVFWPPKQCAALYNLVNCLSKPNGPVGRNMHLGADKMSWGVENADLSVAGIYPHCRVKGTSHADGRFGECYIKFRLKIFKDKPMQAWYATVGNMLANGGPLDASQAAIGKEYMQKLHRLIQATYGLDDLSVLAGEGKILADTTGATTVAGVLAGGAKTLQALVKGVGSPGPKEKDKKGGKTVDPDLQPKNPMD